MPFFHHPRTFAGLCILVQLLEVIAQRQAVPNGVLPTVVFAPEEFKVFRQEIVLKKWFIDCLDFTVQNSHLRFL